MRRGPHWLLNDADAKAYGIALSNALRHLPITAAQKTIDFTALGVAIAVYEGPRVAYDVHLKRQAQAQRQQQQRHAPVFAFGAPAGVHPMPGAAQPNSTTQPIPPAPPQSPAPGTSQTDASGPMTYEPELEAA